MNTNALQQQTGAGAGQAGGGNAPDDSTDPNATGTPAGDDGAQASGPGGEGADGGEHAHTGQAAGEADEGAGDGDDDGGEGGQAKRGANARIREVLAREKAAVQYAEYWRRKALEREAAAAPAQPQEPKAAPTLEQFGGDTARWAKAYAQWNDERLEQRVTEAVGEATQRQSAQATQEQAAAKWNERMTQFAETKPDAYEVIANPTLPISEAMSEVIQSSEKGPELAYHLGRNPGEAARIARMSPTQAAAALGRLEATLQAPAGGTQQTASNASPGRKSANRSNAPPPPNTLTGSGETTVDKDMEMPIEDFLAKITGRAARR